eukprot:jgi/Mesvir1/7650/Mv18336-RA.1
MEETEVTGLDLPTLKGRSLRVTRSFADRGGYKALRVDVLVPPTYDSRLVRAHPTRNLVEVMLEAYPERNRIHISWFSVLAKEFPGDASKEEIATFRGVGRKLLCYGMSLLAPMMKDRRTAIVELEAAGAQCPDESVYNGWSKAKIYYLLRKYENTYASLKDAFAKNDMAKLRRVACLVRDNEDLVRYYNQYGLKATGHDNGDFVDMEGRLTDVLASCESVRVGRVTKAQREGEDADRLREWVRECKAVEVPVITTRWGHPSILRAECVLFDAAAAHPDVTHVGLVSENTAPCLSPSDFLTACERLRGKSVFESCYPIPTGTRTKNLLLRLGCSTLSYSGQFCLLAAEQYRAIRPSVETILNAYGAKFTDDPICLCEFLFITLVDNLFGDQGWEHAPFVYMEQDEVPIHALWLEDEWVERNLPGMCKGAAEDAEMGKTPGLFAIRKEKASRRRMTVAVCFLLTDSFYTSGVWKDWLAAAGPARGRLRFFVHASEFEREDVDSLRKWIWECDAVEVPSVSSRRDHSWLLRAELTLFDAAAAHLDVTHFALVGETTVPCLSPPDFLSACENLYGKSVFESSFALPTTVYANELLSIFERSASSLSTQFCLLAADHYRAIRPRLETTLVEHESESDADNCVCLDEFVFVTLVDHVFGDEGWDHVPSVRVEWDDEDWIRRNLGGACRRAAWNVRAGETPGMFAIRDVIDSLCLRHALERGGVLPTSHKTSAREPFFEDFDASATRSGGRSDPAITVPSFLFACTWRGRKQRRRDVIDGWGENYFASSAKELERPVVLLVHASHEGPIHENAKTAKMTGKNKRFATRYPPPNDKYSTDVGGGVAGGADWNDSIRGGFKSRTRAHGERSVSNMLRIDRNLHANLSRFKMMMEGSVVDPDYLQPMVEELGKYALKSCPLNVPQSYVAELHRACLGALLFPKEAREQYGCPVFAVARSTSLQYLSGFDGMSISPSQWRDLYAAVDAEIHDRRDGEAPAPDFSKRAGDFDSAVALFHDSRLSEFVAEVDQVGVLQTLASHFAKGVTREVAEALVNAILGVAKDVYQHASGLTPFHAVASAIAHLIVVNGPHESAMNLDLL